MYVYTVDITKKYIKYDRQYDEKQKNIRHKQLKTKKRYLKKNFLSGEGETATLFYREQRVSQVVYLMDRGYYEKWEKAIEEYVNGNWKKAQEMAKQTLELKENDSLN